MAKRTNEAQQMRWSRASVQPFLDVSTAVLNGTIEDPVRQCYLGFLPGERGSKRDSKSGVIISKELACSPQVFRTVLFISRTKMNKSSCSCRQIWYEC